MKAREGERDRRDSIVLMLLILLVGFICIIFSSGWALRFAPSWKLPADMGSNLNPDSDFLTNMPIGFFEPLDPSILTNPAWLDVFLTPGASFSTLVPPTSSPTSTSTRTMPNTATNTANPISTPTPTSGIFIPPTNTRTQVPPTIGPPPTLTATSVLPPTPTHTNTVTVTPSRTNTPLPQVDLGITKDDGVPIYNKGSVLTYTIAVMNTGPNAVTGAVVTDAIPAQITDWTWACAAQNGGATGCDAVAGSTTDFADTVNLPNGASIVYTVTANVSVVAIGNLSNTANVNLPVGYSDPNPGNNSATDVNTLAPAVADLQITKTDNATHYAAGGSKQYIITVSNPTGPGDVTGAMVDDDLLTNPNLVGASAVWSCAGLGGGSCTANGVGDIKDSIDLPLGSSVTYTVNVSVVASPSGNLVNTATVSSPADPDLSNNSATDTDTLIVTNPFPPNLGTTPDGSYHSLSAGSSLTLNMTVIANSDGGYDLVYYEFENGGFVYLDMVRIEISDGQNWYTVFDWGDEFRDTNTNMDYAILPAPGTAPFPPPEEADERQIPTSSLYNNTGVVINIDAIVPPGTYSFVRITAYPQPPDVDGQLEVDAIEVLP